MKIIDNQDAASLQQACHIKPVDERCGKFMTTINQREVKISIVQARQRVFRPINNEINVSRRYALYSTA